MTVIPIVISALGPLTKWMVQELEDFEIRGRVEIIPTTALLKSARTLRRVLETWGDMLSLNSSEKPTANAGVKNSNNNNSDNNPF